MLEKHLRSRGGDGADTPARRGDRPEIAFALEYLHGAWRVARVSVRVPGRPTSHHQRVGGWPANAAMEPLAAALALFTIKEARATLPSMNADEPSERVLVERCATLWRNANGTSAKWVNGVFGALLAPGQASGSALKALINVHGAREARVVELAEGRLPGQFRFMVGSSAASASQLQVFVATVGESAKVREPRPATSEGRPPVGHHAGATETDVAIRAKARVRRENIHGRPCLAICGCREGRPEKLPLLEGVLEDLAMLLSECGWHVIHGPQGVGIETVTAAITEYQAGSLTYTLVIGSTEELVAAADLVLVLGGLRQAYVEARMGMKLGKRIVAVARTGMASSWIPSALSQYDHEYYSPRCTDVLVSSENREEISSLLRRMLRDLAEELSGTQPAGKLPEDWCWKTQPPSGRRRKIIKALSVNADAPEPKSP